MHIKNRGWTDEQTILSLILLNSQEAILLRTSRCSKKTKNFCSVLDRIKTKGLTRKKRRDQGRRWRKTTHRGVASPRSVFRYLAAFHDSDNQAVLALTGEVCPKLPLQETQTMSG